MPSAYASTEYIYRIRMRITPTPPKLSKRLSSNVAALGSRQTRQTLKVQGNCVIAATWRGHVFFFLLKMHFLFFYVPGEKII